MRVLLMLLLLANLGFFAWQYWHDTEVAMPSHAGIPAGADKRLVLLEEIPPASALTQAVPERQAPAPSEPENGAVESEDGQAAADPATVPVIMSCATLGPFDEREAADIARARLAALGRDPVMRETGGQIRSGFWVYLPPFPSRDAAEEIEDELRGRNIHDLFIVNEPEQRNAISLGLFSTPERADQRAAEIGRLGYTPRVAERFRDATVYWVDFVERSGRQLKPEAIGVMGAGETLPEIRAISCAEIADSGAGP